ncbi:winged helix DNA-binding domain-containing protein [Streptomyces sp. NBC_00344]|uniref:winged helix DNA-binding domain-containing protein n=1 Tax=Streptomyces sp. NBC_00344 TaxID=2975720 RepID=UPI002E1A5F14
MTTRRTVTWTRANARRLARQHLTVPATASTPADAAAAMLGAHAQVITAAELSIGLRMEGTTRTRVREALRGADPGLVKTYGPRGTVHLLPAADLPLWTGALSAVPRRSPFPQDLRMTADRTEQVLTAIGEALDGTELVIGELSDEVVARTGPWAGDLVVPAFQTMWPRWRQVMHIAAHRGLLAFGGGRGRQVTYLNPGCVPLDGARARAELLRRYLHAYGPATPADFANWLAAPGRWSTTAFDTAAASAEIEETGLGWVVAGDTSFTDEPPCGVRLLPYFDAYLIASRPRELLYPGAAYERALAGGQAGNFPVLLIDGIAAGVWHAKRSGKKLAVTVEPLVELTAARLRELKAQVERTGEIMEGRPELTVGKVTVGPHA